jgi:hypothetical protein
LYIQLGFRQIIDFFLTDMSPAFKFPRNETSQKTILENDHLYRSIPDEENVQTENEFQKRSLSKPLLIASTCGLGG